MTNEEKYIQILEKTNQQLSLGWTPINMSFVILSSLIAFLAIVAVVIIWYQSRDYRDKLDNFLTRVNLQHENNQKKLARSLKNIDKLSEVYKEELRKIKKLPSNTERINELERNIESIKHDKQNINISSGLNYPITPSPYSTLSSGLSPRCVNCGKYIDSATLDGLCYDCRRWPGTPPGARFV